ncbi:MAG: hypothetical protein GC160_11945 [Acidobacteria bacterium]|nr:hypothetical protein [Acidobacteriota bacterium]
MRSALFLLFCWTALSAAERSTAPLRTVESFDPARYAGRWYEIARLPNKFQTACAGDVQVRYSLLDDGRLSVYNECREADGDLRSVQGVARRADPDEPASQLEVRFAPAWLSFLPVVWADYQVIDLAPDYSWAAVGEPTRRYFWLLSRAPRLDEGTLKGILQRAEAQGYDLSGLIRTPQKGMETAADGE